MSEDNFYPDDRNENDGSALVPLVLAIGIGAALIIGNSKPATPLPGTITVSGNSACAAGATQARVNLGWVSGTHDTDYDIIRDGSSIDTVHGGTNWFAYVPAMSQGQTHVYKVIGVQSGVVSNEIQIRTAVCGQDSVAQVTDISAVFD